MVLPESDLKNHGLGDHLQLGSSGQHSPQPPSPSTCLEGLELETQTKAWVKSSGRIYLPPSQKTQLPLVCLQLRLLEICVIIFFSGIVRSDIESF